jgi:uncharacterized membrane protein YagU involved in acid resistance
MRRENSSTPGRSASTNVGAGAVAGFVATLPMTAVMELLFQHLPRHEQYPLPPREITDQLTVKTGVGDELPELHRQWLALGAHFGYGSAMGGLYGLMFGRDAAAPMMQGAVYGLAVWAGSYLGLLPALRILKPATEHPLERNLLMIFAHAIWGGSVGALTSAVAALTEPDQGKAAAYNAARGPRE